MTGELSHGLPELIASGNRILRSDTGQPILLRGVNRSGLEYTQPSASGFLAAAGLTAGEIQHIAEDWRCTILRVPFNQAWALYGTNGHSAEEYLAALDQVIDWAAAQGIYTVLDLQWLDADTAYGFTVDQTGAKVANHVPPLPNLDTVSLWTTLAQRYCHEPAVLFDLFNEPHQPLEDDSNPLYLVDSDGSIGESNTRFAGWQEWLGWADLLISAVRLTRPGGLILLGGVDWAFDLRGIRIDAPGIVYSAHIYPNRKPSTWWQAIGGAKEVPVFLGEWGGTDNDLAFGRRLLKAIEARGLGWTAWSWVDYPPLVQSPREPDYRPTAFGELVRNALHAGR